MPIQIDSTPEFVQQAYRKMEENLKVVRGRLNRPLTFAEKILYGHLADPKGQELKAGESYLMLNPDRVTLQDVTGQMALLQFMTSGLHTAAVPTTVHCDHLIQARVGALSDTRAALNESSEVFQFLDSACRKFGIGFWKPGAGIIHQVMLENYAFPGGLVIGTDSHTPNTGGLGMLGPGVGGADAVDVMAGFPWEVLHPKLIGVRLTGQMSGWTAPKDVILYLCGLLTVEGGTNKIIEYFGPGVSSISATGKGTICNMGAELGATGSVFPYDNRMASYLKGTNRTALATLADKYKSMLAVDPEVEKSPEKFFDRVIEIDLSKLEPYIVGPHSPDKARPVSKLAEDAAKEGYPEKVSVALIGSCTNSSYEDISRAADVARQAAAAGVKVSSSLMVTPGSEMIRATIERDGQMKELESIGATVLANACGPCIGQWQRDGLKPGEKNTIITSFNRNFQGRNDGSPDTNAFIGSPEVVMAYGIAGSLKFNPLKDTVTTADGKRIKLSPPKPAPELPPNGFVRDFSGYVAPPDDGSKVQVPVDPKSTRLQLLEPFPAWDGKDLQQVPILVKVKGKCTTDHISPAGPWLRFRGHLDKISDNMWLGATNAYTNEKGKTLNVLTGERDTPGAVARKYKAQSLRWVAIGDTNYGEGSSREHAAMSPRLLGCGAVIVRSFARIHESNLKKQGVLPFTFANPADWDKVKEDDRISIVGLKDLAPGKPVKAILHHKDGNTEEIQLKHTMNQEHIVWFKAGSALNVLRTKVA